MTSIPLPAKPATAADKGPEDRLPRGLFIDGPKSALAPQFFTGPVLAASLRLIWP